VAKKNERHFAIKEIINTKSISSQDELRLELRRRGFRVTQATLSRDLRELGIGRVTSGNRARYVLQPVAEAEILRPVVGAEVVSVSANESMIVIRTLPGCASSVGEFIDSLTSPDIIGTIAGDNTLLVIPQSRKRTKQVAQYLKEKLIGTKK
jgi:transcriptional regulator of arginine metabolism